MKSNLQIGLMGAAVSAVLSALSVHFLEKQGAFYWGPGVAFALCVIAPKFKRPELLAAVVLSYTLGYASGEFLEDLGTWPMRIGVVAIGSGLLASSLRWKGGLKAKSAPKLFALGTVLALPFWTLLTRTSGEPSMPLWIAGFAVWQIPVAWYYLKES